MDIPLVEVRVILLCFANPDIGQWDQTADSVHRYVREIYVSICAQVGIEGTSILPFALAFIYHDAVRHWA